MSNTTLYNRTEPWPHPSQATRYDGTLATDHRPWCEGWHAADNGHVYACSYNPEDEAADRADWVAGWSARWSRLHPDSEGAPWTIGA